MNVLFSRFMKVRGLPQEEPDERERVFAAHASEAV